MQNDAMNRDTLQLILQRLHDAEVRFLIVGGVAVNLYGYARATQDLDLVLSLAAENVLRALDVFDALGYRPVVPLPLAAFCDPEARRTWREERNMEVFSLQSDQHPLTTIDLFVHEPFSVDDAWHRAPKMTILGGVPAPVVPLDELIRMKETAGRARDLDDLWHLRLLQEGADQSGGET